ncbi:MAG: hypothetical protein WCD72_06650 [Dehalococcoidia bacterium]
MEMNPEYRVGIFCPWYFLDTIPSLCAVIEFLAQYGYQVEVFVPVSPLFELPTFDKEHIRVHSFGQGNIHRLISSSYLHRAMVLLQPLNRFFTKLPFQVLEPHSTVVRQHHREIAYRCVIGVDPAGLEIAGRFSEMLGVPLLYWSLELLLSSELTNYYQRRVKKKEIALSHSASAIVIQDEERAKLLAKDNNLPMSKFVFVPNAPLGPAGRYPSRYWHQQFGLGEDRRIVLHSGSLGDWTGIADIVSSVKEWPEDRWVLVAHTRFYSAQDSYLRKLRSTADSQRVFFSTQPVTRTKYPELVAGADVGVALYFPFPGSLYTQENIHTIGLSSGKIAHYLRAGLPIIVNKWPSISQLVKREGCGIVVDKLDEVGDALIEIERHYKEYSNNACRIFEKYFDPSMGFQHLIRYIGEL